MPTTARRIIGAVVGGALGYVLTILLGMLGVLPLALLGGGVAIGAGSWRVRRELVWTIVFTIVAVASSVVHIWSIAPLVADPSFVYFITNPGQWAGFTWLSLGLTALLGVVYSGGAGDAAPPPSHRD